MDILLNKEGDIELTEDGDIRLADSVTQKIRIRIRLFLGEWKWDEEWGLPYMEDLFIKNPMTEDFELLLAEEIFEVEEIVSVDYVDITVDNRTRTAKIRYVARTDYETIREEMKING